MSNPGFVNTNLEIGPTGPASPGGLLPAFFGNSAAMRAAAGLSGPGASFGDADSMGFSLSAYVPDGSLLAQYLVAQGLLDPSDAPGVAATYPGLSSALQADAAVGQSGLPLFGMPAQGTLDSFGFMVDPAQRQQLEGALQQAGLGNNPTALALGLMMLSLGFPLELVTQLLQAFGEQSPDLGALPADPGAAGGAGGAGGLAPDGGGGGAPAGGATTGGTGGPAPTEPTAPTSPTTPETPATPNKPTTNNLAQLAQDRLAKQNEIAQKNSQIVDLRSKADQSTSDALEDSTADPALKDQYNQALTQGNQAKGQYQAAQGDLSKLRTDVSREVTNISNAAREMTSLENQLADLETKAGEKDEQGNATPAAQEARNQAAEVRTRLRAAAERKKAAETAKADLEKRMQTRQGESDQAQRAMTEAQNRMDALQLQMVQQDPNLGLEIMQRNADTEAQIADLHQQVASLQAEVQGLEARMQEVQAEVDAGRIDVNGERRPELGPQPGQVENASDATRILGENFDALDDVFDESLTSEDTDGIIGRRDLEAVASGDPEVLANLERRIRAQAAQEGIPTDQLDAEVERRLAEAREAAEYLTSEEHRGELDDIDTGAKGGDPDGRISREDVQKAHEQAVADQRLEDQYRGQVGNAGQAAQILQDNFAVLDDVFDRGLTSEDTDGIIGQRDLEAVASGDPAVLDNVRMRLRAQAAEQGIPTDQLDAYVEKRLAEIRAASAYLVDRRHDSELKDLDVGGDEGWFENRDGRISREDLENILR